ncbi:hypothetical protein [Enterocloster sp.]|uniref:hypothetical protein n=1 Tax=Enterocloster sp. TaxID=2719315 RepID=UPI0039A08993
MCIRHAPVEEARKKLSDDLKIREKLELVVPMIESGFIYNLLRMTRIYTDLRCWI